MTNLFFILSLLCSAAHQGEPLAVTGLLVLKEASHGVEATALLRRILPLRSGSHNVAIPPRPAHDTAPKPHIDRYSVVEAPAREFREAALACRPIRAPASA
ncbi:MAG: hypothetical protein HY962_06680 [Ignavibacteriae bacterium]|nr:hypothetical protein [Ignavibacteriota bacterium]